MLVFLLREIHWVFIATSKPIAESPVTTLLLGGECCWKKRWPRFRRVQAVVGWGAKPSGQRAEAWALKYRVPCWHLEDGFLRSYLPGHSSVGLSLVVDEQGIYYDATRPSDLESLLASNADLLSGLEDKVALARSLITTHELSKYNHAPTFKTSDLSSQDEERVLVVDQTFGDLSVMLGLADIETFDLMVETALAENPHATIYIKTHPEVSSGSKTGFLSAWPVHPRVVMLRDAANPISLLKHMSRVYVVSSTLGFEALLAGKPVTVFGMPWYAGWGSTDDRQICERRNRQRSVAELFAAGYFHYTRYVNPETHDPGSIFDVIRWLIRQKESETSVTGRRVAVGLNAWKAVNLAPLLSLSAHRLHFVPNVEEARALNLTQRDSLLAWGRDAPEGVKELSDETGARRWRIEDGFIRSVGLGAHMVQPLSLVLDGQGIYFDPSEPSDLEALLAAIDCSEEELSSARLARHIIVREGLTKYNVDPRAKPQWAGQAREVVFVPGQVEDDASIRYGTSTISTNLGLLQAARKAHPDSYVVYKPHPDVMFAMRQGNLADAKQWADYIETKCSVVSCLEHCDVVHTMTSLTGFDALLRGKKVVTYGEPFYAGWGLTEDRVQSGKALNRRQRKLTLDELVVGALLRYPRYWDPVMKGFTTCESVLRQIIAQRNALEITGKLGNKKLSFWRRKWRKKQILKSARSSAVKPVDVH
nr:capsular polysaccharide biosynthesis protein [Halomonas profundi]